MGKYIKELVTESEINHGDLIELRSQGKRLARGYVLGTQNGMIVWEEPNGPRSLWYFMDEVGREAYRLTKKTEPQPVISRDPEIDLYYVDLDSHPIAISTGVQWQVLKTIVTREISDDSPTKYQIVRKHLVERI